VLLGDVADIVDGLENDKVGGWYQGTPASSSTSSASPAPT
jgi:multidrug efflux pump subunit AcrB